MKDRRPDLVLILAIIFICAVSVFQTSCAPWHTQRYPSRKTPTAAYAADFTAFAVGMGVGMNAQYDYPQDRTRMAVGYSLAALFWLPYWFMDTR